MTHPPNTLFAVRLKVSDQYCRDDIPASAAQHWAVFPDATAADEHARQLHREFVRGREAFAHPLGRYPFGQRFEDITSLPEPIFRDWLMDEGIDLPEVVPPTDPEPYRAPWMSDREWTDEQARWAKRWAEWTPERRREERDQLTASLMRQAWQEWWEAVVVGGTLTPVQLARVWEGLNKVRFFEVVEVPAAQVPPAAPAVFAVVHEHWEYDDSWYCGANDPLAAFSTRAAAEAELARRRVELGADGTFGNGGPNRLVVIELPLHAEG